MPLAARFINKIKEQELYPPISGSSLLFQENGWNTQKYFHKFYQDKTPFPLFINVIKGQGYINFTVTKFKKLNQEIFKKNWQNEECLQKIDGKYHRLAKRLDRLYSKLTPAYIQASPLQNIAQEIRLFRDLTWDMNALLSFAIYLDEAMVKQYIKELDIDPRVDFSSFWLQAINPQSVSFENRHATEILESLDQQLPWDAIAIRSQYTKASYAEVCQFGAVSRELQNDYKKYTDPAKRALFFADNLKQKHIKEQELKKYYSKLSQPEKKIYSFVQKNIEFRDKRKDYILKMITVISRLAEFVSNDSKLPINLMHFFTLDELLAKVKPNFILELERRAKGCSVLINFDGKRIFEYEKFNENHDLIENHFNQGVKLNNIKIIKGSVGAPGIASGRVRIIHDVTTGQKVFKKGEVLVTSMTRPEFVRLMKRASAIITNEGGVTCHAAIVAREMKKPCIIGTKIATKVLKDGDLVEVDADNGVVKIIK